MIATIFCLPAVPLFNAIAQVESDRGATSSNVYQIRKIYVKDVNRFSKCKWFEIDVMNKRYSEEMMREYWYHYASRYRLNESKPVTYEVLARIHNGGPNGYKKASTLAYWERVKKVLIKELEIIGKTLDNKGRVVDLNTNGNKTKKGKRRND
jgi:transglutaminase-like putative cysteine protease